MKGLFLLLFVPAVAFAQNDSVPMPARDEVLKIAEAYREKNGFKKELIFSRTSVVLNDKTVKAGAFLGITPQSLVILHKGDEVVIPRDSISVFSISEIQPHSRGNFGPGFVGGFVAGIVVTNYISTSSSRFFLSGDYLLGSAIVGVLAGTGLGYLSDLGSTTQNQYFTLTTNNYENDWAQVVEMLKESKPRGKVAQISLASAHVYRNLTKVPDQYALTATEYDYNYYQPDVYSLNLLRRFSFMLSPGFLKNFSVGISYMNLDEPWVMERGRVVYQDTAHRAFLNVNLAGEGLFGVVAYPIEVLKNTYCTIGAGAGRAIMDYSENIRDEDYHPYYSHELPFPESNVVLKGRYFSALAWLEFSHLFENGLSLGLTGDYVWVDAPALPLNPIFKINSQRTPFNTFSLGVVTGISF
jgi:hypothetical protein